MWEFSNRPTIGKRKDSIYILYKIETEKHWKLVLIIHKNSLWLCVMGSLKGNGQHYAVLCAVLCYV